MNTETLIAVNIGLPVVSALASLLLGDRRARAGVVYITAAVLVASSLLLYDAGGLELNPGGVFETAVVALDFVLLLYFLYQGFVHKSWQFLALWMGPAIIVVLFIAEVV